MNDYALFAGALPERFKQTMEGLLGTGEYQAFLASYNESRHYGLRANPLKVQAQDLAAMLDNIALAPIPWVREGFYYPADERPGKHPYYNAGLYYIQEPSAMAPVELLGVEPGDRVLDLCAAPGGKSTQIAGKLQGAGILVTNDNARERMKALAKNIELAGVRNAVVLNEEPERLAAVFKGYFDKILVDAPCSGEGMFRKEPAMAGEWERHSVEKCAAMQQPILRHAAAMLAPGGTIVYSTCTFSPVENEQQIAAFLVAHPDFEALPAAGEWFAPGRPDWVPEAAGNSHLAENIARTARIWPHLHRGEGHYIAVLRHRGERAAAGATEQHATEQHATEQWTNRQRTRNASERCATEQRAMGQLASPGPHHAAAALPISAKQGKQRGGVAAKAGKGGHAAHAAHSAHAAKVAHAARGAKGTADDPAAVLAAAAAGWAVFAAANLAADVQGDAVPVLYGSHLYLQPPGLPSLDGLQVVRPGWYIGDMVRGRFEPSQPLAQALQAEEARSTAGWPADSRQVDSYLRGETVIVDEGESAGAGGYVLVCVDGYPLGWGKWMNGAIKNGLAPGWRRI